MTSGLMKRFAGAAVLAVMTTAAFGAGVCSADTTLATGLPTSVKVAMRGGTVAWSAPTAGRRWKLVLWRNGTASDAAVATRATPFDVDLGDDGHGHLVATYSRCSGSGGLPPSTRPRGCDVYLYAVSARTERRVSGLGAGPASDYLPTAAGGRIAFARSVKGGPARLYVRALTGGTPRRLTGGLQNADTRTGPRSLDLGARGLGIAWATLGPAAPYYDYGAQEVRFDLLHGGHRLLARYTQGDISGVDVVGVSVTGSSGTLWAAQGNGENGTSKLYLVPQLGESSDSRTVGLAMASASGSDLQHAVVLACDRSPRDTQAVCSVVALAP